MRLNKKIIVVLCTVFAVALISALIVVFILPKLTKEHETVTEVLQDTEPSVVKPDEIYPFTTGDVTELCNVRFRVNGRLVSDSAKTGVVDYVNDATDSEESTTRALYVSMHETDRTEVEEAVRDYMTGSYDGIYTYLDASVETDDLINYYYAVFGENVALFYSPTINQYISVIPCDGGYLYVYCDEEFYVTRDTPTRIFDNPTKTPLTTHTFSRLEQNAVDNTIKKLLDAGYTTDAQETDESPVSYESTTAELTYTNASDNETRDQLAKYDTYHWNADGTSNDTSYVLDLNSVAIKNSRWTLVESSAYSFTDNGLNLAKLYGSRTTDSLKITGVMTNKLSTPRPWVLVIELLDEDERLLGVRVVDERKHTIDGNGTMDFEMEIKANEQMQIANIKHLQFIMY